MRRTKIVAAMLSLVFVFMLFPSLRVNAAVVDSGTCGDPNVNGGQNVTWTLDDAGTLTISGVGDMADYPDSSEVPWHDCRNDIENIVIIDGVASTGDYAFSVCSNVKSVSIPVSVKSIGKDSFGSCFNLTSITIPNSVTSIGNWAFADCTNLTSITIPDSVTTINVGAFYGCINLTSIAIPNSVTTIGGVAFQNCTSLTSITIPNSVTSLGDYAFDDCTNLTEVTMTQILYDSIDASMVFHDINPTINKLPSGYCGDPNVNGGKNVIWVYDDAGTLTISGKGDMAKYNTNMSQPWYSYSDDIETIVISDGITSTGDFTFACCENVTSILISNSVTSIGNGAFDYCTSLTSITIPDSVTDIGKWAFDYCTSLTSITIPDNVTSIGIGAFYGCTSLTGITIPDSVTSIGANAFSDCTSLKSVTIGSGVTSIEQATFWGCKSLESITIPDNVQDIGVYAFEDCTSLADVTMSKTLYDKLVQNNKLGDVFYGITLPSIHFSYTVDYKSNGNGTITGTTKSFGTDEIELTITPDTGYEIDKVTWSDGTNPDVELTATNGKYTMPDSEAGTVTITASFKLIEYNISFVNEDGTVLQSSSVSYGDTPVCTITPTKAADAQYTYTFSGWTPTIAPVAGDTTYTATYSTTTNEYTVTFTDADGNQLQSGKLPYGSVPAYNGTPTKAETDKYTYTFAGWKSGNSTYGASSTLPQVTGDVTYTAVFTETAKPTTTPAPGTYYVQSIEEKDGAIIITIKRTENDDQTYELVQSIETDGKQLTVGDQIELTSGSAIITIKKDFVSTLTPGTHTMKVTFKDGGSITLEYTVKEPEKAQAAVQATGEAISAASIAGACLILTAAGIAFTATRKRKEEA